MNDNSGYWYACREKSSWHADQGAAAPMFRYPLVAHALGGKKGKKYTNTLEALEYAYSCGYRFVETDLLLTEDGCPVLSHGFNEKNCKRLGMEYREEFDHMTGEMFLQQTVFGMRTMDAKMLYSFMKEHKDLYVELDMRELSGEETTRLLTAFKAAFCDDREALDRCILQFYNYEMCEAALACYPVTASMMLIRREYYDEIDKTIGFCREHGICAAAINNERINSEVVEKIKNAGMALLVYTVDNWQRASWLLANGADTICTNFIDMEFRGRMLEEGALDEVYQWTVAFQDEIRNDAVQDSFLKVPMLVRMDWPLLQEEKFLRSDIETVSLYSADAIRAIGRSSVVVHVSLDDELMKLRKKHADAMSKKIYYNLKYYTTKVARKAIKQRDFFILGKKEYRRVLLDAGVKKRAIIRKKDPGQILMNLIREWIVR